MMFCRSANDTTFCFCFCFCFSTIYLTYAYHKALVATPGHKYLGRRAARASQTSTMPMEGQLFYHSSSKQITLKRRPPPRAAP